MTITYIFHSGFALETDSCILVFDYWMDPAGVMPRLLSGTKPVYVLVSHFHEDHFNREIFTWRCMHAPITYILSKDILKRRRAAREEADVWLAKGGMWQDDIVCVRAAGSNDSGVSWFVETGGYRIFHAGDLNNWYARFLSDSDSALSACSATLGIRVDAVKEEKCFLGELKDLYKMTDRFDVVMFPVDGRIGNGYTRGGRQFVSRFRVGLFVPMHFVAGGFESAWRMKEYAESAGTAFWSISCEGDTMEY